MKAIAPSLLSLFTLGWLVEAKAEPVDAVRFTVELTDGSRILGSPIDPNLPLNTGFGPLTLKWHLLKSVEKIGGGAECSIGADDSGHGHPLTVKGAQSADGRIGKGAATGGPNEGTYFIADSHPDLQFSGDFTLAVWAWRSAPIYDGDQLIAKEGEFSLRRYQLPTERYDVELCEKHGLSIAKVSETKSGLPLENWTLIVLQFRRPVSLTRPTP